MILECPEKLIKLLSRSPGIDHLVPQGKPLPDYDVYCALMNVPGLTATSVEAIPAEVPYIFPDPELVEHWKRELAGEPGLKVGINWQGNPKYAGDRHRSIPLEFFEPLSRVPGVRLFSLQKNAGLEQLDALGGKFPGHRPGPHAGRDDRAVHGYGGGAQEPRSVHHLRHGRGSSGRGAGGAGVDAAVDHARLAVDDPSRRQPVVPDDADLPPERAHGVGAGVRADGGRAAGAGARAVRTPSVTVAIAPGELIDKITILEIKAERITDPEKLRHVRAELAALSEARDRSIFDGEGLAALVAELKAINESLWDIEDEIRSCEREGDFGTEFVELARSVYETNDRRAAVKRRINERLGSEIVEEKSYAW